MALPTIHKLTLGQSLPPGAIALKLAHRGHCDKYFHSLPPPTIRPCLSRRTNFPTALNFPACHPSRLVINTFQFFITARSFFMYTSSPSRSHTNTTFCVHFLISTQSATVLKIPENAKTATCMRNFALFPSFFFTPKTSTFGGTYALRFCAWLDTFDSVALCLMAIGAPARCRFFWAASSRRRCCCSLTAVMLI